MKENKCKIKPQTLFIHTDDLISTSFTISSHFHHHFVHGEPPQNCVIYNIIYPPLFLQHNQKRKINTKSIKNTPTVAMIVINQSAK